MNRIFNCLIGAALISLSASAQEAAPAAETQTNQTAVAAPEKTPAEKLYLQAVAERESGEPKKAIQTVAQVVAFHSGESDWLAKSEMLCAELYMELGLTNAAYVTAKQVQSLHQGTASAEKADALRLTIEKLKSTTNGETKK
jgi:outer membrane protein assembly factor BamD (BamD/ComL family)